MSQLSLAPPAPRGDLLPHDFKTLDDPGVDFDSFSDGIVDPVERERILRDRNAGALRRDWCWIAVGRRGRVMARHRWWGLGDTDRPMGVDLLSVEEHDSAVGLLAHARQRLGVDDAWCEVTSSIDAGASASDARPDLVAVLTGGGFTFEVARVKVEWIEDVAAPADSRRLSFRPARDVAEGALVALFRAVADDSLDHGMTNDRRELGADQEALKRLKTVLGYRGDPGWFSVAFDEREDPVGYVIPCLMENDIAVIGEIGVAADHRGRGYVTDLLARATRQLSASGATRIVADTDTANSPMRAAFTAAGYTEVRWRDDYRWRSRS